MSSSLPSQVHTLDALSSLVELHTLNLSGVGLVKDLHPLMNLRGLRELDLSYMFTINSIEPIASLTSLTRLGLNSCFSLKLRNVNLDPIKYLSRTVVKLGSEDPVRGPALKIPRIEPRISECGGSPSSWGTPAASPRVWCS
jgi:hypothetical protein